MEELQSFVENVLYLLFLILTFFVMRSYILYDVEPSNTECMVIICSVIILTRNKSN